jgi:hypothetical protein
MKAIFKLVALTGILIMIVPAIFIAAAMLFQKPKTNYQ